MKVLGGPGRLQQSSRFAALGRAIGSIGQELRSDRAGLFGLAVLAILVFVAIAAPYLAPHDPAAQSMRTRLLPPFWMEKGRLEFPLGTDYLGRDILSRMIYGAQASLLVGVAVIGIAGSIGTLLGIVSGYVGGRVDSIIMRIADTQIAFPGLLLALTILAAMGASLTSIIVVLCLNEWMIFARMARSAALSARQTPFIEAAEMVGARPARVVFRHLLPNFASPLMTLAMLEFANVLLAEAGLSFLGVGVQPPATSWGLDVAAGKQYLFNAWWLVTFPGLAIALTVLATNLVASWLRIKTSPIEREKQFARRLKLPTPVFDAAPAPAALENASARRPPVLSVSNLSVDFETRRGTVKGLRGISFSVAPGETLGIVGESGSGKSVTAQAIMGLINVPGRISGGDVRWKGRSLLAPEERAHARSVRGKEIAIVFQDPMTSLDPLFTIGYQIEEVLRHHLGLTGSAARARAAELLELVGMTAPERRLDQYPHEFSGGMRQRALIAMALACEPELLIADEPTTALDVTIQLQILDLLKSLQAKMGLAIVLITHDLGVVARVCDRVAVMYGGRIVEQADAIAIFERPSHPYTAGLIRSTPRLSDRKARLDSIEGTPPNLLTPPPGCAFSARCSNATGECSTHDPHLVPIDEDRLSACWREDPALRHRLREIARG